MAVSIPKEGEIVKRYDDANRCVGCGEHMSAPCQPWCAYADNEPEESWDDADSVPCPDCGAAANEPCKEGCPQLVGDPWETQAAAWNVLPWERERKES